MLSERDKKIFNALNRNKQKINITQWIEEVNEKESKSSLLNSELLAVMMEIALIKAINKQEENFDAVIPHPDNFRFFRKDILRTDWNVILGKINGGQTLRAEYFPNKV